MTPATEATGVYYSIAIQTSDIRFSGTDANVRFATHPLQPIILYPFIP